MNKISDRLGTFLDEYLVPLKESTEEIKTSIESVLMGQFLPPNQTKADLNVKLNKTNNDLELIADFKEQICRWISDQSINTEWQPIDIILNQYKSGSITDLPHIKKLLQDEIKNKQNDQEIKNKQNDQEIKNKQNVQKEVLLKLPTESSRKYCFAIFPGFLYILLILVLTGIFFCLHSSIAKNADRLLDDKKATDSLIRNAGHGDLHLYENTTQDSVLNKQVTKVSSKADSSIILKSYHNVKENKYDSLLAHRSSSIPAYLIVIFLYFLTCLLILFFIYRLAKNYFQELVRERLKAESWKNFSLIEDSGFLLDESDFKKFWDESVKNHFEKPVFQESSLEFLLKKIFLRSK